MRKAKQSTAKNVMVLMVDSTDHVTGKTGLTLTITASKDGGAFASISPTVTERGSGWYSVALTAAHTDTLGDLALHVTAASADPADMVLLVEAGATDADVSSRLATAGYTAPDNATIAAIALYTDSIESRLPAALVGGRMDASVGAMATDVLTAAALAADAVAEIQSGLATLAGQATIAGYIDTEVAVILAACAAIQAKTDSLTFTVAGQVDANVQLVNDIQVTGNGQPGTEWGPV